MKKLILTVVLITAVLSVCACGHAIEEDDSLNASKATGAVQPEGEKTSVPPLPQIEDLSFTASGSEIALTWGDELDDRVAYYEVMRAGPLNHSEKEQEIEWTEVGKIDPDGIFGSSRNHFTEAFPDDEEKFQYFYRVDAVSSDEKKWGKSAGIPIPVTNYIVCIDPGHFGHRLNVSGEDSYSEAEYTLATGLELRRILKEDYGIEARMTRETDSVSINGLTDSNLDHGHISLRGEYAAGCDFFISIHTNANLDNANNSPTLMQPKSITKPVIILNRAAESSLTAIRQANLIGINLSRANYEAGVSTTATFKEAGPGSVTDWTDALNDAPDTEGTLFRRLNSDGSDCYGVLLGSNRAGVPGIIVEHAHHTVPEVRKALKYQYLYKKWAEADAAGIGGGLGFINVKEKD